MLENAMREPWENVIERIREILSNSRRLRGNIRRAGINQPIANIKWDTPDWPITTAVTPVNPSEHDIPQPIFPIFWLIIILIIPLSRDAIRSLPLQTRRKHDLVALPHVTTTIHRKCICITLSALYLESSPNPVSLHPNSSCLGYSVTTRGDSFTRIYN
jgi:hypothetical protein